MSWVPGVARGISETLEKNFQLWKTIELKKKEFLKKKNAKFCLTYAICTATRASMGFLKNVSQFGTFVENTESLKITYTVPERQNAS